MAKKRHKVVVTFELEGVDTDTIPNEWTIKCQACEDVAGTPLHRGQTTTVTTAGTDTRADIQTAIMTAVNAALGTT